jgi:hypothetical protein
MTAVLVLNVVLAIVVVGALLRLLSWAIISSRTDQLRVKTDIRRPARHPYAPRPHAPHPHRPNGHRAQQGARAPLAD